MKNKLLLLVLFGLGLFAFGPELHAQVEIERTKNITKIGGKEYYMHPVKQGQTLWGISQAYNVSIEEIENLNPEVKDGLKAGHVLGIPVRPPKEEEPKPVVEEPKPVVKDPEPVVEEPEPEPVVNEPEPEPESEPVVEEPEPGPVVNEPEPEPVVETPVQIVEEPEPIVEPSHEAAVSADGRVVKRGEDLYDIAKEFGIDISDFKFANPGLTNDPA